MFAVLAFVSLQHIIKAFEELVNYLLKSILPVVNYFKDNFIDKLYIIMHMYNV